MYQAAIVEDEDHIRSYLRDTLVAAFNKLQINVTFDLFPSGEKFLSMFDKHFNFDIIFLDIEMTGMDGISVCRQIREINNNALVIFISNKEELVFQTFEVQPFRFIRKSDYDNQLPALVDAISNKLSTNNPQLLRVVASSGDIFSFDVNRIMYIEAQRKLCRVITTTGEQLIQCKLKDLSDNLEGFSFLKPHRSYLVNCKYIYYIEKTNIILTNDDVIPVSRNSIDEIKQQFLSYTTR